MKRIIGHIVNSIIFLLFVGGLMFGPSDVITFLGFVSLAYVMTKLFVGHNIVKWLANKLRRD